jgi:hypothetical protein
VSRLFGLQIHGEPDLSIAREMIEHEAGPDQLLAAFGIDGIILARDSGIPAPRADEWELALESGEDQVFHRRGVPLPIVRSVEGLKDSPNQKLAQAEVRVLEVRRQQIEAEIAVPSGRDPACLLVSRPYFPGYIAELDGREVEAVSYRGLVPMIKIPAGTRGRLTIRYRPNWLLWGGGIAIFCALGWIVGLGCAAWPLVNKRPVDNACQS